MSAVQIAEVQDIQGTAYAVNADGERRLLQAGDALFDGESVETSEGGVVELTLSDGQSLVIAGQPVFLISADLIADLAPGADESALQAETLDELLAEGSLESLEQIIESTDEAEAESLDDLLAAAEEDPTASGIDFDNLAATAAGGDDSGADGGGSNIVQATRISSSGDDTSATLTGGNTQAAASTDTAGGANNSISVAVDDAFAISEDTSSAGNLADNDALAGDVTFALVDQGGPSNGAVTLNEDGTFVFTPNTDFVGDDSFQYVITDANGQTSTATVSITVEAVNDAPVAIDDVVSAQEDVLLENINVLDNDTDSDGNPLTVTNAVSAAGGVVTINADGTLSYQAPANFTGPDTINYTIDDGAGGTSTAVVNIDVAPVADLAAADDFNTGDEDTVISGSVADNDTTLSGGALTYAVESTVENGALTFNADGSYEYVPNPNFNGADSFTYVVTDAGSGESFTQSVTLTVDAVSDLAATDDQNAGDQDTVISGSVADNDTTLSGGTLTYAAAGDVQNGSLTFNTDGTYSYTPEAGFSGTDSFDYVVTDTDSGESFTQTVTLTVAAVNDAPVAVDDVVTAQEDVLLENINVLGNDTDSDGNPLTVTNAVSAAGGVVTINADGTLSYQAPANFTGPDTINYTIDDGAGGTSTAVVNIDVAPVADLAAADDFNTGDEDTVISGSVADNDTTLSGGALTYAVESTVENGALTFNADGSYEYVPNSNFNGADSFTYVVTDADSGESLTQSVTLTVDAVSDLTATDDQNTGDQDTVISGSVADNDTTLSGGTLTYAAAGDVQNGSLTFNTDGTYSYTPEAGFSGTDSFDYVVTDTDSGESFTQTVTLTVAAVNDAPVAVDDVVTAQEDVLLENINVLGNDTDSDGNPLTVTNAVSAAGGVVTINADGTLNYQAPANFTGPDTINYTIDDGAGGTSTAVVNIDVAPVADLAAADDQNTGDQDTVISGSVADNDTTLSGGTLTYAAAGDVQNGSLTFNTDGTYSYTPEAGFSGTDSFDYVVTDTDSGESFTQTVTLTVAAVNDAPVAVDDVVTAQEDVLLENINVLGNDTDSDGNPLTVTNAVSAAGGVVTINADGTLNYQAPANFTGPDTINYTIDDGAGGTSTAVVNIDVAPVADLAAADDQNTGDQDTVISGSVADNDTTLSGGTLTYAAAGDVQNGSLTFNTDGTYSYTPEAGFSGTDSFDYVVTDTDSGESFTQTVTLTVAAVNDAPVAVDDVVTAQEDVLLENINVLGNDTDSDGNPLTVTNAVSAAGGVVTINADGTLNYQAPANFTGPDTINYTIDDGAGGTSTAVVNIDVAPVADLAAADDQNTGDQDTVISGSVADNDTTLSGGTLTYAAAGDVQNGSLTFNTDGTYSYTPEAGFSGTDSFDYVVTDTDSGESFTQTVTLTVAAVNDAPVAVDDVVTAQEDVLLENINVLGNDTDSDGNPLTVTNAVSAAGGVVTINADGTLNYQAPANFTGPDTINYTIDDGAGGTSTAVVNIDVAPVDVNQAPIAQDDRAEIVQNVPLRNIKVLDNDEDPEGGVLTVTSAESASDALVSINADGTLNYTPNVDFLGADTVTYTITDPSGATAQASLVVVISEPQAQNALEGEPLDVYLEDTESLRSLPAGTTVTVVSSQGSQVTISEDGVLIYQAPDGFTGEDVITYTTDDGEGNVVTKTVVMQVYPQDAALVGIDDSVITPEDASVLNIAVLANDKIAEGSDVTVISATSSRGGQVDINADGTLNYTPPQDFTGIDAVTYTARNGDGIESTATLSVEVTPENDPPVAVVDAVTTLEDTPLENINVLANDIDVDGDTLTVLEVSSAEGAEVTLNDDGTVNYLPNANFNGVDTITYSVSDGLGGVSTGELKISVEAVNDAPVVTGEQVNAVQNESIDAIAVLLNDEDPDGNPLSVEAAVASNGGTVEINGDGTLKYTPAPDFVGEETLTYTVIDGQGGRVEGQVTVVVALLGTLEDTSIIELDVLANIANIDGDAMTLVSVVSAAGGAITLNGGGTINYAPPENYFGSDTLTYTVTDSAGETITGSITIDIIAVNDAPVVVGETIVTEEDVAVNNIVVLTNDSDIEGDALSVTAANSVNGGAVTINEDGTLNYVPLANFNGTDTIEYTVTDAGGAATVGAVLVTVNSIDDQPIASTFDTTTAKGVAIEGDLSLSVESGDAPLVFALMLGAEPQHGVVELNDDGTFIYTPDEGFSGRERFGYTVTDEDGDQASSVVTIAVIADSFQANTASDLPDDVPVAASDTYAVVEDTPITARVTTNDDLSTDGDGANLVTVAEGDGPTHGTLAMSEAGVFVYTPEPDFFGQDTFTYTLTDASGDTSTATVTLNVVGVNDDARFEGDVTGTMAEDGGLTDWATAQTVAHHGSSAPFWRDRFRRYVRAWTQ